MGGVLVGGEVIVKAGVVVWVGVKVGVTVGVFVMVGVRVMVGVSVASGTSAPHPGALDRITRQSKSSISWGVRGMVDFNGFDGSASLAVALLWSGDGCSSIAHN